MFRCLLTLLILPACFAAAWAAKAQDVAAEASAFFQSPPPENIEVIVPTKLESEAIAFRNALDDVLNIGDITKLDVAVFEASSNLRNSHPQLVSLGAMFSNCIEDGTLNREKLEKELMTFESGSDWYAGMYADTVLSALHVSKMELLLSAQFAQSALERIPAEVSSIVTDAQLLLAEQMTMLYGVSANTEQMLATSQNARRLQFELGQSFDHYESLTNFLLAFNWKRDHDGARAIAEMLVNEPRPESVAEGLAEVYIADLYNEVGDHSEALRYALMAKSASDPLIQRRSGGEAMIAYAGLGQRDEAIREMRDLGLWDEDGPTEKSDRSEAALHARSLMAAARGDATEAVSLMNRRLDHMIGRMYDLSANDTASLLSHLENNRERQQERENALQREAELQAVQLEQKSRLNRLLWILIAGLALAFNFLLAFLRYREKNNRQVHDLQEEALSAERMKTEFLGVINHELRTPLNGIIGMSDAMIHHAKNPVMKEQAITVQESGQLLHDLLDSLITMSTIEGNRLSLDSQSVCPSRLILREAAEWEAPAERKGLEFTYHVSPELDRTVLADGAHLRKCAKFLLSNAVRFTHSGRIHLHATGEAVDQTHMSLTLIVADTGQGISETVQSRLFKPFLQADNTMTRKYGGAGLSLAIARKLARMMGGDLTVNSREGRGSEFTFTARLPLSDKAIMPSKSATADRAAEPRTQTDFKVPLALSDADILVAEEGRDKSAALADDPETIIDLMLDHPMFAPHQPEAPGVPRLSLIFVDAADSVEAALCDQLCADRYDCRQMSSSEGLIQSLKRKPVDAVVMNLGIAGLNPVETMRVLRELPGAAGRVPVIGLTRPETASLGSDLIMAGMDMFLTLPLSASAFEKALAQIQSERDAA